MTFFKKSILFIFLILSTFFYCSDTKNDETYTLSVTAEGGNFTGYYELFNDGESKTKGLTGIQGTGSEASLYQYKEDIDALDTIDIHVSRLVVTTSLSVKLYKYDEEVADEYLAGEALGSTTTTTMSLRLKYDATSDETDTTDTTDTTTSK